MLKLKLKLTQPQTDLELELGLSLANSPRILKTILGGTPFWPLEVWCLKKITTPALPMTPLFYRRILFYSKSADVFKKSRAQYVKI